MSAIVYLTNGWFGAALIAAVLVVVVAFQGRQQRRILRRRAERDRAANQFRGPRFP